MTDCRKCRFCEWDYEEYFNSRDRQWFVSGCQKDIDIQDGEDCCEFEEFCSDGERRTDE